MADTDDALKHFTTGADDPYALLDLPDGPASTEKDIRSAWKKTALKFHPDKLRAKDAAVDEATANRLYILRQDAYGILSEPHLREQYDNALRAKEQKKQRDAALTGKRKAMKEDLERREDAAKRQKVDEDAGEVELERLRADGQRRRRERAEMLRRQAEAEEREERERGEGGDGRGHQEQAKVNGQAETQVQEIDRVVKLKFPHGASTAHLTRERVTEMFSRFGAVEGVTLKEKKVKVEGEKHRKVVVTAAVIFQSIVGAHAAVSDFAAVAPREQGDWLLLEPPQWASGREPEAIPNGSSPQQSRQRSAPLPTNGTSACGDVDDILMIRLKNAEKKRREDKKRREEEAAATAVNNEQKPASPPPKAVPTFASFKAKVAATPGADDAERKREAEKKRLEEEMRRQEAEEDLKAAGDGIAV